MSKNKPPQDTFTLCAELLGSMSNMFDARVPYTENHSQRIMQMAINICEAMKIPAPAISAIALAAMVHDIGNIGIPPAILNKNSQLTPDEWKVICEHPNIGAELIEKFAGLDDVAEIVRHHHERWNGLGYPDRLKENNIPFGARVLSLCESVDAMLSYRPYRKTMLVTEAKADIQKNAGSMYDPTIAKVLLDNWDTIIPPIKFI